MSSSNPWSDEARDERAVEPLYPLRRVGDGGDHGAADHDEEQDQAAHDVGTIEVLVRLTTGDTVLVGRFGDFEDAKVCAEALVQSLGQGEQQWPFVAGRFLRPGAIVSIDVSTHGPKWTGSADRAASWRSQHGAGS